MAIWHIGHLFDKDKYLNTFLFRNEGFDWDRNVRGHHYRILYLSSPLFKFWREAWVLIGRLIINIINDVSPPQRSAQVVNTKCLINCPNLLGCKVRWLPGLWWLFRYTEHWLHCCHEKSPYLRRSSVFVLHFTDLHKTPSSLPPLHHLQHTSLHIYKPFLLYGTLNLSGFIILKIDKTISNLEIFPACLVYLSEVWGVRWYSQCPVRSGILLPYCITYANGPRNTATATATNLVWWFI